MATKKKLADVPEVEVAGPKKIGDIFAINIADIALNRDNPRDPIPTLRNKGYCLFPDEVALNHPANKFSLWRPSDGQKERQSLHTMLLSEDANDRAIAVAMIADHEPAVASLADSIQNTGQIVPCEVTISGSFPDGRKKYKMVEGATRLLAKLYISALLNKKNDITLRCEIKKTNAMGARYTSFVANFHRKDMNPVEVLQNLKMLRDMDNQTDEEIARTSGLSLVKVKDYFLLENLPSEALAKLQNGTLALYSAVARARAIQTGKITSEQVSDELQENEAKGKKTTVNSLQEVIDPNGESPKKRNPRKEIESMLDKKVCPYNNLPLTSKQVEILLWLKGYDNPAEARIAFEGSNSEG